MGNEFHFQYHYANDTGQFTFFRIPKLLIKDARFKSLSNDAKLLYGLMLDRLSLSLKNQWLDEENRVYIYYSIDDIMQDLGCARATCSRIMNELDSKTGIGLIERIRQGQGKPNIIYVMSISVEAETDKETIHSFSTTTTEKHAVLSLPINETSIDSEVQELNFKKFNFDISKSSDVESLEVQLLNTNDNNINNTEYNNIISFNQSKLSGKCDGKIDEMDAYIRLIKENLAYDFHMIQDTSIDRERFESLYDLVVETVCVKRSTIRICGAEYPYEIVKSRFLKLTDQHLIYVMNCLDKVTSKIKDIKGYLLSSLYNASLTMNDYYSLLAQHDLNIGVV